MKKPTRLPQPFRGWWSLIRGWPVLNTPAGWKEPPATLVRNAGNCKWRAARAAYSGVLTQPLPKGPLMNFAFWMDEQQIDAATAAGAQIQALDDMPPCPFHTGDTVSFGGFRPLAYRVAGRHYRANPEPGQPHWLIHLEPVPHPLEAYPPERGPAHG